ncbi:MAG TPA: carboxypeptidase regulatory-like domain-containing protein [Planctomycetaceae bacterium]|nr:carboxypeptidase regulatory-like domain-containing protein [Planctomycetaceae bacterium]
MMCWAKQLGWAALAAFFAFILAGCGAGTGTLETEYVEGVVTLDGKPVAGATVTFQPVTAGQGMAATGVTDEQGKYTLTAVGAEGVEVEPGAGTLPGEYYVGVVKIEIEGELTQEEAEEKGIEFEESVPLPSEGKITYIVPQRYNSPRQSGIQVTVEKGENVIPIELTSR